MVQIVAHMYHFHPCVIVTNALHPGLNYPTINKDLSELKPPRLRLFVNVERVVKNRVVVFIDTYFYRPQRSWAKVMFLQVCVILFTGGGCLPQCMLGYHPPPPWEQMPPGSRHPPRADTPREQTHLLEQTPPGKQTTAYGKRAAGTHPTGMHSCGRFLYLGKHNIMFMFYSCTKFKMHILVLSGAF